MSFPKIPDMTPYIDISFEDSINLLLSSIAMEEMSLSKLMDAETCKILHVLKDCGCKNSMQDALKVNKSVDSTIKNMIKLQMLLQFKLEDVKELIPTTTTTTTTTWSTTTTTCSASCPIIKECCCNLIGNAAGCVTNRCDAFFDQTAVLHAFVFNGDYKNRSLRYTIETEKECLYFEAFTYRIKLKSPCNLYPDRMVLYGTGTVLKKSKSHPDCFGDADFTLTVWDHPTEKLEFKMELSSKSNPKLSHDSGFVPITNQSPEYQLAMCC